MSPDAIKKRNQRARRATEAGRAVGDAAGSAGSAGSTAPTRAREGRPTPEDLAHQGAHAGTMRPPFPDAPARPKAFFSFGRGSLAHQAPSAGGADGVDAATLPRKLPPLPLSLEEARSFRETLIGAFMQTWPRLDEGMTATNRKGAQALIWSSIDRDDTEAIVDVILERARKNGHIAQRVREFVDHWAVARVGVILVPRLIASAQFYGDNGIGMPPGDKE